MSIQQNDGNMIPFHLNISDHFKLSHHKFLVVYVIFRYTCVAVNAICACLKSNLSFFEKNN